MGVPKPTNDFKKRVQHIPYLASIPGGLQHGRMIRINGRMLEHDRFVFIRAIFISIKKTTMKTQSIVFGGNPIDST